MKDKFRFGKDKQRHTPDEAGKESVRRRLRRMDTLAHLRTPSVTAAYDELERKIDSRIHQNPGGLFARWYRAEISPEQNDQVQREMAKMREELAKKYGVKASDLVKERTRRLKDFFGD